MNIGGDRWKAKDYFKGWIKKDGEVVCSEVKGTYMGHMDCDGQRYFDLRDAQPMEVIDLPVDHSEPVCLESDSRKRIDLVELFRGNVEVAQENKHKLEVLQRNDRKLREAAKKRRAEGGAKIKFHWDNNGDH